MAIKLKLKTELESRTRRLGTRADSYLNDFFDTYTEFPHITNMEEFFDECISKQNASDATKRQVAEVFTIYRIIDVEGNIIIPKIIDRESFIQVMTANLKTTISRRINFESNHRNNYKLLNNIVYIYGVTFYEELGYNTSEIYDESMNKRVAEMRTSNIIVDNEFKEIVKKEFRTLLDECDHPISQQTELKEHLGTEISKVEYSDDAVETIKRTIESYPKNVFDLIKDILDEEKVITIPFYQREYVWTTELIENFVREIASNENSMLNIGNILISINNSESNSKREYALVDGQQRLTSLILIMNYIAKSLKSVDLSDVPMELRVIVDKCMTSKMVSYVENKSNPEYLRDLKEVLDLPIDTKKKATKKDSAIKVNYDSVSSIINSFDGESKKNLLLKLAYVISTVTYDGSSDEIELFISTNASRKPLSNYDLIRSFIISKIPDNLKSGDLKTINDKMENMTKLLKFEDKGDETWENTFFTFYLNYNDQISFNDSSKSNDLFKRFESVFRLSVHTLSDVNLLLDNITSTLLSYRIAKGVDKVEDIYLEDFLLSLGNGLKVTSIYEIFIVYFVDKLRQEEDRKLRNKLLNEFRSILLIIEQFEIKWKLFAFAGDSLTNTLTSLFAEFYGKVNDKIEEGNYDDIHSEFRSIVYVEEGKERGFFSTVINNDKYNDVEEYIKSESLKKDKIALKILNRVAFNLFNNDSVEYKYNSTQYFYHSKPTIEHIFPKKNTKWQADDKTNAVELIDYLENIGNKFIFNKDENSSAGNKTFKDKLEHYKDYNNLKLDKTLNFKYHNIEFNLLEKEKWTPNDVVNRSYFIIESLLKIWE